MAGNKNSGKRPGGKDFAPKMRSMIDRVLQKMDDTGKAEKLLEEAFEADFVGTARALAPYAPKQVDMSVDQTLAIDTTQLTAETLRTAFAIKEESESGSPDQVH